MCLTCFVYKDSKMSSVSCLFIHNYTLIVRSNELLLYPNQTTLRLVSIAPDTMKFSLFSTTLLMAIGLSTAAPFAEPGKPKDPPGPPDGTYGSVSQSCSASQSSIHCCQANGGQGKDHKVKYQDDQYNLVCSQIFSGK